MGTGYPQALGPIDFADIAAPATQVGCGRPRNSVAGVTGGGVGFCGEMGVKRLPEKGNEILLVELCDCGWGIGDGLGDLRGG